VSPSSSRPESSLDGAAPEIGAGLLRNLLQSLDVGIAVADPLTMQILFENERFFEWFAPDPAAEDRLGARLPALDLDKLSSRLGQDRSYTVETATGSGARATSLEIEIKACALDDREYLIAECRDVSDRKQAESMLDSYSRMADKNARDLRREKERAEKLLLNLMPKSVYEEMKDFGSVAPQRFDDATILMLDFVGFTEMAVSRNPGNLVSELNDIFSAFDRIVELFNCERMKTIGDAYLAVSGLPEPSSDHAENVARVALRIRRYLEHRNTSHREPWLARIGIHSGPVVGSIVGVQKYAYDIFGPGVNLAARMEALSEPMQITITEETFGLIGDTFVCSDRGEFDVKGFGSRRLYSLDDEVERQH
jgi:class 3 adenylate cyclase